MRLLALLILALYVGAAEPAPIEKALAAHAAAVADADAKLARAMDVWLHTANLDPLPVPDVADPRQSDLKLSMRLESINTRLARLRELRNHPLTEGETTSLLTTNTDLHAVKEAAEIRAADRHASEKSTAHHPPIGGIVNP